MADTNESTKVKSKAVTSHITASRQNSNPSLNTPDGASLPTEAKAVTSKEQEAEKIRDQLARLLDVIHNWPCKETDGKMVEPLIYNNYIYFAFAVNGHVIKNSVTSDNKQDFIVDGITVIPVTSEAE